MKIIIEIEPEEAIQLLGYKAEKLTHFGHGGKEITAEAIRDTLLKAAGKNQK